MAEARATERVVSPEGVLVRHVSAFREHPVAPEVPVPSPDTRAPTDVEQDTQDAVSWDALIPTQAPERKWGSVELTREQLLALPTPIILNCSTATADQVAEVRNYIEKNGELHVDHRIHLGVHVAEDGGRMFYIVDNGAAYAAVNLLPAQASVLVCFRHVNGVEGALAAFGEVTFNGRQRVAVPFEQLRYAMEVFRTMGAIRGEPAKVMKSFIDKRRVADVRFIYKSIRDDLTPNFYGYMGKLTLYEKLIGKVAEEDLDRAFAASEKPGSSGLRVKLTWKMITLKVLWKAGPLSRKRGLNALRSAIRGGHKFNTKDIS